MSTLDERLEQYGDISPSCMDYKELLQRYMKKYNCSIEEARKGHGDFTYTQWKNILSEDTFICWMFGKNVTNTDCKLTCLRYYGCGDVSKHLNELKEQNNEKRT